MEKDQLALTFAVLFLCISTVSFGSQIIASSWRSSPVFSPNQFASTTIAVDPANITKQFEIGQTFSVNITVANVHGLYVWQAGMTFNATILEAIDFIEGSFLAENGTTLWTPGTINNAAGVINYHASVLAGNVTGVTGNGTLCTVIFKVRDYGDSNLQLTEALLLNSELENIDKTSVHGFVRIKIQGDINGDELVDVFDIIAIGKAYGSAPGSHDWNPEADINGDLIVDAADLATYNGNYGKTT